MDLFAQARRLLRGATLDVIRYHPRSHPLARRMRLLATHGIDVVLDVGANIGQYGEELRRLGYRGRIVSFEPMSAAFAELQARAQADGRWQVIHAGLGAQAGTARINLAGNSASSS